MNTSHVDRNRSVAKPSSIVTTNDLTGEAAIAVVGQRVTRACPTPHLTPDQYIRMLASIEDAGGISTLDEVSRALPLVRQPISAVLDLCDAGILTADWEAAFDGNMRIWRLDR